MHFDHSQSQLNREKKKGEFLLLYTASSFTLLELDNVAMLYTFSHILKLKSVNTATLLELCYVMEVAEVWLGEVYTKVRGTSPSIKNAGPSALFEPG